MQPEAMQSEVLLKTALVFINSSICDLRFTEIFIHLHSRTIWMKVDLLNKSAETFKSLKATSLWLLLFSSM